MNFFNNLAGAIASFLAGYIAAVIEDRLKQAQGEK